MGPVELLFISLGIVFVLITFVRGYAQEIGTTFGLMMLIFLLTLLEQRVASTLSAVGARFLAGTPFADTNLFLSTFFTLIFVAVVFAGYAGAHTFFNIAGGRARAKADPILSFLLNLSVGLLNAYLISGTLWYYQDRYGYPIRNFVTFQEPLTPTAQVLVKYLPPRLFDNPVYWVIPVAIILLFRLRG